MIAPSVRGTDRGAGRTIYFLVCRFVEKFGREIQDFGREIWAPQAPLREGIFGARKREIRAPQAPQEEDLGAEGTGGDLRAPQAPLREGISGAAGVGKREIWAPQAKAREGWEGI